VADAVSVATAACGLGQAALHHDVCGFQESTQEMLLALCLTHIQIVGQSKILSSRK
jgi:hypothetical protein